MIENTLLLIKPNITAINKIGQIISIVEQNGFVIKQMKLLRMTEQLAMSFYSIHKGKPFFTGLVEFMTSGNIVAIVLQKENAVMDLRTLVGKTNPANASINTLRYLYGESLRVNAVHASDSVEHAKTEIEIIF